MSRPADDFAEIVREHQAMVFRVLGRMVGSQDVDDLAQEVFLRLLRALPYFERRARVSTYLYRIVINVAQDEWKRRRSARRVQSLSDPAEGWEDRLSSRSVPVDAVLARQQVWNLVQDALSSLSATERAALVLFHQEDRSYRDIANILDVPIGTVRTHLHRGREKLAGLVRERMRVP